MLNHPCCGWDFQKINNSNTNFHCGLVFGCCLGFFNHKINKKTRKLFNFEPPKVGQS